MRLIHFRQAVKNGQKMLMKGRIAGGAFFTGTMYFDTEHLGILQSAAALAL